MRRLTKRDLIIGLNDAGRDVDSIAAALETHPSYVANVLAAEGKTPTCPGIATARDARLRDAAPDLLRACRNALRDWPVEFEEGDRSRPRLTPTDAARINELRAAILKAGG